MNKNEKLFFIFYGMVIFPLLLLLLVMKYNLDKSLVSTFLVYMAAIKTVYAGAEGFSAWNSTPDIVNPPLDDEGH